MNTKKIRELFDSANGVMSVTFTKRTDGTIRTINCMPGNKVRQHLSGGKLNYDPSEHDLYLVYLMNGDENREKATIGKNRRSIPLDAVISAKINGKEYVFDT